MKSKLVGNSPKRSRVPRIVAVVPAYNEAGKVGGAVSALKRVCDGVVVISDGSTDRTAFEAAKAGATVVQHETTSGYSVAVRTGMSRALEMGAEFIVTADGDGAHFVEDIPPFVGHHIAKRAAMTIGSRFHDAAINAPSTKRLANVVAASLVSKVSRKATGLSDVASGLRVFSPQFAGTLVESANGIPPFGLCYYSILLAGQNGQRLASFPARVRYDGAELLYTRTSEFVDAALTIHEFAQPDARLAIRRLLAGLKRGALLRFELDRRVIYGVPIESRGYIFQEQDAFYEEGRTTRAVRLRLSRGSTW